MATPSSTRMRVVRLGERALLARVGDQTHVHALADALLADLAAGALTDVVPADRTLLVTFDGTLGGERIARRALHAAEVHSRDAAWIAMRPEPRRHRIPVHYGGTDGPDLRETAALAGCTPERLIDLHAGRDYTVLFVGFAPGFAYLGEVSAEIVVPRLSVPRTATRPGSVAIAESYTGVYPADLPGGWRVIGWTPVPMFDPTALPPARLVPGDLVRFEPMERGG
jgi:KipI family sensor histidine kinase inhibitor